MSSSLIGHEGYHKLINSTKVETSQSYNFAKLEKETNSNTTIDFFLIVF